MGIEPDETWGLLWFWIRLDQNSVPKRWVASCWTSSRLGLTKDLCLYDPKPSKNRSWRCSHIFVGQILLIVIFIHIFGGLHITKCVPLVNCLIKSWNLCWPDPYFDPVWLVKACHVWLAKFIKITHVLTKSMMVSPCGSRSKLGTPDNG